MDILLSKVTQQAMNYAIRSGITITSGYAISQCGRLLKTKNGQEREELGSLQRRLDSKIRIISPAIDMIELITARGNTSLESAVTLTKALRWDIQALGVRLSKAAADEEASRRRSSKAKTRAQMDLELRYIISDMKSLLERIEDAVPLINLAITTSGVSLSTNLPASVSPSRLLQASTFLSAGDAEYSSRSALPTRIGPSFTLSMYMLFSGHAPRAHDEDGLHNTTWQEVMHKARVKLLRTGLDKVVEIPFSENTGSGRTSQARRQSLHDLPLAVPAAGFVDEFAYQLLFVEDLDDDRVHTVEEGQPEPGPFDDVATAGIREVLPIHQISKIFYADTGKILNIGSDGETNNPVLLLKRDINASPPRRMMSQEEHEQQWTSEPESPESDDVSELEAQFAREAWSESADRNHVQPIRQESWRLPPGLDPEWIALEVFIEDPNSDSEFETPLDDTDATPPKSTRTSRQSSMEPGLTSALSNLRISQTAEPSKSSSDLSHQNVTLPDRSLTHMTNAASMSFASGGPIKTSLSLLEMLIRLTSLQQFQQASHLTITDELLNFFLEEASTTGAAAGDVEARKRIRMAARQRVGFDPYDESPIKRRGEEYQYHHEDAIETHSTTPPPARTGKTAPSERSSQPSTPTSSRATKPYSSTNATPDFPHARKGQAAAVTPPSTTKSRQAFLRHENGQLGRGSPLARSSSVDNDDEGDDAA